MGEGRLAGHRVRVSLTFNRSRRQKSGAAAGRSARRVGPSVENMSRGPSEWTSASSVSGRRHLVFGGSSRSSGRSVATSNPLLKFLIGGALTVVAVAVVVGVVSGLVRYFSSSQAEVAQVTVVGHALPPFDAQLDDPAAGLAAPEFAATTFGGDEVSVQPGDGTAKVIAFFAHWCLECKRELPRVANWLRLNPLPAGVEVVAVSTDVIADRSNYPPSAWFAGVAWPAIVVRDSEDNEIGDAYGLTIAPYTVVVDGRGRVVARVSGELTDGQWETLVAAAAGVRA